ncbi:hypothetical protein NDU88_002556 [Pleurodeles waltl]|uniref:Uncharacterized protein n=1 Tax=Pleurodeles waltl TaxID=8319 RepID=A0AAV7T2P2_PLEWA|nr:hypothetical protein NDU88_002556 [Pleurodeles waltl]
MPKSHDWIVSRPPLGLCSGSGRSFSLSDSRLFVPPDPLGDGLKDREAGVRISSSRLRASDWEPGRLRLGKAAVAFPRRIRVCLCPRPPRATA